jgi:hypothetical protein
MILPPEAQPLRLALAPAFTAPTFDRFTALLAAAVLVPGRRTVANLLRTLGPVAHGHRNTSRRVLSAASGSGLLLGTLLARFVLRHLGPDGPDGPGGPVVLIGDDTVDGRKGKYVYGKARHRDPVRSTHAYTTWRYGHTEVVLAVLVRFPFAARPWALPVLVDLYRWAADDRHRRRPHRTPAELLCRLLRRLLIRCPARRFVVVVDVGYGTHPTARFCYRHRARLTLVSKFHPDANLYQRPARTAGSAGAGQGCPAHQAPGRRADRPATSTDHPLVRRRDAPGRDR